MIDFDNKAVFKLKRDEDFAEKVQDCWIAMNIDPNSAETCIRV